MAFFHQTSLVRLMSAPGAVHLHCGSAFRERREHMRAEASR